MCERYENNGASLRLPRQNIGHSATMRNLFVDYMFHGELKALIVHLNDCPMQHDELLEHLLYDLSCMQVHLVYGQQMVRTLTALKLLLQFGAKWNGRVLFWEKRTPYHIISKCHGDHHELLNVMIKSSEVNLLNVKDSTGCTAVMHAVQAGNIQCLKCLIVHNADLNIGCDCWDRSDTTPLIDSIQMQHAKKSLHPSTNMRSIFNLLLASGVDLNKPCKFGISPIKHAVDFKSIYCAEKLIQMGAQFDPTKDDGEPLWFLAARCGNVNLHKYLIEAGFEKNCTDPWGRNALYFAISRGDYPACHYLLGVGVTLFTPTEEQYNQAVSLGHACQKPMAECRDPGIQAISMNKLDLVKLLGQYGCKTFQSIEALRCAMIWNNLSIVEHLLSTYNYPLNLEYMSHLYTYETILTEACIQNQPGMVALLVKYGADPAMQSVHISYKSAIIIAMNLKDIELVAHFIRCGVNLDYILHAGSYGYGLPFEFSIRGGCIHIVQMLLYSSCSRGEFSLKNTDELSNSVTPEIKKLMIDWEVHQNNVTPLLELCRKSILYHLYPAAGKIDKLPLPPVIIKYLSIPELDDIVNSFNLDWHSVDRPRSTVEMLRRLLAIFNQQRRDNSAIIATLMDCLH